MRGWRAAVPVVLLGLGTAALAAGATGARASMTRHGGLLPWPGECREFRLAPAREHQAAQAWQRLGLEPPAVSADRAPVGCRELEDASLFAAMGAMFLAIAIGLGHVRSRAILVGGVRRALGLDLPAPRTAIGGLARASRGVALGLTLIAPALIVHRLSDDVPPWAYIATALTGIQVAAMLGGLCALGMGWIPPTPPPPP